MKLMCSLLKQKTWKVHGLVFLTPSNVKYQKETSLGHIFQGWVEKEGFFFSESFSFFCIKHNSFEPPRRYVGG